MSRTNTTSKVILVTGATGKQGRATVSALRNVSSTQQYHILGLTRNASSPGAKKLTADFPEGFAVVEGDLNSYKSIRDVFERSKREEGGIWGVFAVFAYAGLGNDASGEERQGKILARVAHEYGVGCFIYSSAERAGEMFDDEAKPGSSHAAKVQIEKRVKELGVPWTILRPTYFMENFEGHLGGLAWSIFSAGMNATSALHLIAVDDIGRAAAGVFQNPETFLSQVLVLQGDKLTSSKQDGVYRRVTGRSLSSVPVWVARGILAINAHLQEMINMFDKTSVVAAEGKVPEIRGQLDLGCQAIMLGGSKPLTFEEWIITSMQVQVREKNAGWNKVSMFSLLTGRH
ncbi:hypothetical protein PQX77_004969 [Marasmius sp. AFHP31]|nr:hypothetical protein PQX77_004969 [Marasmius sp. AFHP31]